MSDRSETMTPVHPAPLPVEAPAAATLPPIDFEALEARMRALGGTEASLRVIHTAHHEAAHALVATLLRVRLSEVHVRADPEAGFTGLCECPPSPGLVASCAPEDYVRRRIAVLLAGPIGAWRLLERPSDAFDDWGGVGGMRDLQVAMELAAMLARPGESEASRNARVACTLDQEHERASRLIDAHEATWRHLARTLFLRERLSGREVRAIVRAAARSSAPRIAA